jgi:hypothetical protein
MGRIPWELILPESPRVVEYQRSLLLVEVVVWGIDVEEVIWK